MTNFSLIYVTAPNNDEALAIGKQMVEARLASCANVVDRMQSVYWWEGKIEEATESILLLKTRNELVESLMLAIKKLHSYKCPCIVSLPITDGNPQFLNWIKVETKDSA